MNPFQAYQQYATRYPDQEQIGAVLFDTVAYTSAATVALNLFNAVRAPQLSNMEIPSQLPNPKAFLIRAISFNVLHNPTSTARAAAGAVTTGALDDIAQLIDTGVLTLTIGSKPYAQFPLWALPGTSGPYGIFGSDGNTADPGNTTQVARTGYPMHGNGFTLSKPVPIVPMMNFIVVLTWPLAITLSLGGTLNVQVIFDGTLIRPVQ